MDILVTYDVATPDRAGQRRLAKVAALCERYGTRVQYSVFECRLADTAVQRLVNELLDVIDRQADSIRTYRFIGPMAANTTSLGRGATRDLGDPWIL